MKTIEQIALEVAADIDESGITEPYDMVTFAHRFLAEWKKQQVPVAWILTNGEITKNEGVMLAHESQGNTATNLYTLTEEE